MKRGKYLLSLLIILLWASVLQASAAEKQTIYNSPYVSWSPDGKAWTTNAGQKNYTQYDNGTRVSTGIPSTLRSLRKGEHYYENIRFGEVPVGFWQVEHKHAQCIHSNYPPKNYYYGINYGKKKCFSRYFSGWIAYCADCSEPISDLGMLMYMSREAAESIDYIDMVDGFAYYYLCPFCTNLEQGASLERHACKAVSWNQYKIEYSPNVKDISNCGGYMTESFHMYNNGTEYEGEKVTPVTHLTKNAYTRTGYEFTGWNTKPDGSGISYQDGQEILNLTDVDCNHRETWTSTDEGTVMLYAQWRPSASTLKIDAAGGSYQGKGIFQTTQDYSSKYQVNSRDVSAPAGHKVSFETNGGIPLSPVQGTRHFTEWSMVQPFEGRFLNNTYYFMAPDGTVDTLTARYAHDPITLPTPSKPGSSFGGWFFDPDFKNPAGGPGDAIIPDKDTTLYAQWIELKLYAKDNYRVNGGRGAVDLSWEQPDGNNKTYLLYQSRNGINGWTKINASDDIGNNSSVRQSFSFSGSAGTYTAPYAGLYTISAEGAQGGNYGSSRGGLGGRATAKVWLSKGEAVTYNIGGQNGYNGGGSADMFANGGGCTVVSTDKKGTILIAGGGGGASSMGNGNAGGSAASVAGSASTSGAPGQDGGAGGGGGYQGGSAGELIVHHHTEACYRDSSKSILPYGTITREPYVYGYDDGDPETATLITERFGSAENPIPTEGNTSLQFEASQKHRWGNSGQVTLLNVSGVKVYNQDGTLLFWKTLEDLHKGAEEDFKRAEAGTGSDASIIRGETFRAVHALDNDTEYKGTDYEWLHYEEDGTVTKYRLIHDKSQPYNYYNGTYLPEHNPDRFFLPEIYKEGNNGWWGTNNYIFRYNIPIPEDTTGIYVVYTAASVQSFELPAEETSTASLSGGKQLICGYTEGQVVSSKPAYGGSNYINTSATYNYTDEPGVRAGNGAVSIASVSAGYQEGMELPGVTATDYAAPDRPDEDSISRNALEGGLVEITWREPEDNGTDYYHMAESYLKGSTNVLSTSNITKNTLTSGIKGYYYLINTSAGTSVNAGNGAFTESRSLTAAAQEQVQYLHLAAVDAAGNISGTAHVDIDAADVRWKLYTRQLSIEPGDNVHPGGNKTWYVKADGRTPFTLQHSAYMDGAASLKYQLNYTIYETAADGETARNVIRTPSANISEGEIRVEASGQSYSTEGEPRLVQYPYSVTVRSNKNKELSGTQKWILDSGQAGKHIQIIPAAGADQGREALYSNRDLDVRNSITIIGDSEAPVISGLEPLNNKDLIDRREGTITLQITARDDLSGVRDIAVEIYNTDNTVKETYTPDASGKIVIDITEDEPIFSGDFIVTATATDNVGNVREEVYSTTEFALETGVERILEPHDPIFKCGESGILTITTWGYADRVEVEFPSEFTELNPDLNTTYVYTETPQYKQEERLQFMIPLYAPTNRDFTITVRAYKGDKQLEDYPSLSTIEVDGTILDEIRTRLR